MTFAPSMCSIPNTRYFILITKIPSHEDWELFCKMQFFVKIKLRLRRVPEPS